MPDLRNLFIFLFIFILALSVFAGVATCKASKPVIESKTRIEPEIRLEINNNRVDTVFIYRSL